MISLEMNGKTVDYNKFNYPAGETHVEHHDKLVDVDAYCINFIYENDSEIVELCLLKQSLSYLKSGISLNMPYVPFSREDRQRKNNCFSLKWFCELINGLNFKSVTIHDAHSDVTTALLNNVVEIPQEEILYPRIKHDIDENSVIVCPDSGALKKTVKLISKIKKEKGYQLKMIQCTKNRDVDTGNITDITVHSQHVGDSPCVIVDDICDGGGTFIGIAKKLKKLGVKRISLCATHGFFTKGKDILLKEIDVIY